MIDEKLALGDDYSGLAFIPEFQMASKTVLLVDDDPNIRRIAQIALSNIGKYDVRLAACGADALRLVEQSKPDLILLDVMMPDMDGPTTLNVLKEHAEYANIPVIFVTAKVQKHELDGYTALGALGVIIKPFDPMNLCNEIQSLLNQSATQFQPTIPIKC